MKLRRIYFGALILAVLSGVGASAARAGISASDQSAIRTRYMEKVLVFHKCYRMVDKIEIEEDGSVKGNPPAGFWEVDGAFQVKSVIFGKDRVALKGMKLWADIKGDGTLHYFPVKAALSGLGGYPEELEVTVRTGTEAETVDHFVARLDRIFVGEGESKVDSAPPASSRYIRNEAVPVDIDPASNTGFKGTPPKPVLTPQPVTTREAGLVGQVGHEKFVLLVDAQGTPSVVGFTKLLQYGLEDATIEAVKKWKFEPAILDGKPVPVHMAWSVEYLRAVKH